MRLETIRRKLDKLDARIVKLIAERQSYMPEIGELKRKNKLPYYQKGREEKILKTKKELAQTFSANPELVKKIFLLIFKDSRRIQRLPRK